MSTEADATDEDVTWTGHKNTWQRGDSDTHRLESWTQVCIHNVFLSFKKILKI